jgi:hypothetical protein
MAKRWLFSAERDYETRDHQQETGRKVDENDPGLGRTSRGAT